MECPYAMDALMEATIVSGGRRRKVRTFGDFAVWLFFRWLAYDNHSASVKVTTFLRSVADNVNGQGGITEGIWVGRLGVAAGDDGVEVDGGDRKLWVARYWTASRNILTISSRGSERNRSISGSVRG